MTLETNKKTWQLGTKYGIEQMTVNEEKTIPYAITRVRSAVCMYIKRNGLDWKFKTAVERDGIGTRIRRIN